MWYLRNPWVLGWSLLSSVRRPCSQGRSARSETLWMTHRLWQSVPSCHAHKSFPHSWVLQSAKICEPRGPAAAISATGCVVVSQQLQLVTVRAVSEMELIQLGARRPWGAGSAMSSPQLMAGFPSLDFCWVWQYIIFWRKQNFLGYRLLPCPSAKSIAKLPQQGRLFFIEALVFYTPGWLH